MDQPEGSATGILEPARRDPQIRGRSHILFDIHEEKR
jgi:hypothetical protein